jgi:hypothetical protein
VKNFEGTEHLFPWRPKMSPYTLQFVVMEGVKYYKIDGRYILVTDIDKLREDEWVYDSTRHNERKVKTK